MAIPGSYSYAVPITKSDSVVFAPVGTQPYCDAIWVGGAGIVIAIMADGTEISFTCVDGTVIPVRAIRVKSTGTTATLMVALYYC